jgi:hypothetical protein
MALTMGIGQEAANGHKVVEPSRIPETNGV